MRFTEVTVVGCAPVDWLKQIEPLDNCCRPVIELRGELFREEATKTAHSTRDIDLSTPTLTQLERYIAEHRKRAARWFAEYPPAFAELLRLRVGLAVRSPFAAVVRWCNRREAARAFAAVVDDVDLHVEAVHGRNGNGVGGDGS